MYKVTNEKLLQLQNIYAHCKLELQDMFHNHSTCLCAKQDYLNCSETEFSL